MGAAMTGEARSPATPTPSSGLKRPLALKRRPGSYQSPAYLEDRDGHVVASLAGGDQLDPNGFSIGRAEAHGLEIVAAVNAYDPEALARLTAENARLAGVLERERTAAMRLGNAIHGEVNARQWAVESRGPYAWDDDEYRKEFGRALDAIEKLVAQFLAATGARDLTDCPQSQAEVDKARAALAGTP